MAARYAYRLGWRSIKAVAPHLSNAKAREVADALGPAFHEYGITNRRRAGMAVAQFAHESAGFRTTTEYATGAAYEGRRDLGNTVKGDGVRFRGRGYIQITGRTNYKAVKAALSHDFLTHPNDLALPKWAAKASCWWWKSHGLNQIADRRSVTDATRRINGGLNGLVDRKRYYVRAMAVSQFLVPRRRRPT